MQLLVELFARDLAGEQALARVGDLILGIHPRALGHGVGQRLLHFGHAVAGQGGNEEHLGEIDFPAQLLRESEQRFFLRPVDLVEDQDLAFGPVRQRLDQRFEFVAALLDRIDQQQQRICAFRAFPCGAYHRAVQPPFWREDAGGVDKDHLRVAMQRDAEHPGARGLRLGTGDRDLLAHELIDQRGLARIRSADHGDDAALRLVCVRHIKSVRAEAVEALFYFLSIGGK